MLDDDYDTIATVIASTTTTKTTATTDDQSHHGEGQSDDSGYTASPQSPSQLDFEVQECKPTPCSIADGVNEHLSLFEESLTLRIPIPTPTIKSPIVLLERCDKIWNTLQLIKTMQCDNATGSSDDCHEEEEREETSYPIETEQTESFIKNQPTLRSNKVPFSFLVQKTRKLYPCVTCGKQYLERRSLRNHSERVHGVVMPLLIKRKLKNNLKNRMDVCTSNPASLFDEEDDNLGKLYKSKDFYSTTVTSDAAKLPMTSPVTRSKNVTPDVNCTSNRFKQVATASCSPEKSEYARCALCRQKVKSVKQHLINYHKIGCSSSMMRELESSLSIKNRTSARNDETMPKSTLSDKLLQISTKIDMQDKSRIMDGGSKARETAQVRRKRKHTLSYVNARKRLKLDMNHYTSIPNATVIKQRNTRSSKLYKCEICLGIYASANSYAKHRRIHIIRGETKENFHKFKCRYFNSPLNEKNRLSRSSLNSTNSVTRNTNNSINRDLRSNILKKRMLGENGKTSRINQADVYGAKTNKNSDTTCICGRSFRNPHTLFVHKNKCKLCNNEDEMAQDIARDMNSDKDSGSGINITIKKRNNSYEIVGKDSDEDKFDKPDDVTSDSIIKSSANTHVKHQQLNTYKSSEYSKDHSVLKLQNSNDDDDEIVDIEDDVQIISDENDELEQIVTHGDDKSNLQEKQNDDTGSARNKTVFKIPTLKQMCRDVLGQLTVTRKPENAATYQEAETSLRSLSKTNQNVEREHAYNEREARMVKIDISLTCGYCNERFDTVGLYNKHQCTVREGKEFDEFSQHLLCFCCSEILSNFNEFDQHMKRQHLDDAYYCYQCPNRFLSDRERRRHCRAEHSDTSCRFCSKKLVISVKALHEGYHLGFGHPCHRCKKTYTTRKKLLYHNSTIHNSGAENAVICNICLRSVKLKTFRRHMYSHNNNECHFCGKVFTNRTGMEYHTLVYHRGTTSKLKCNTCNTRFFTKKQLEKHEEIDRCGNPLKTIKKKDNKTYS